MNVLSEHLRLMQVKRYPINFTNRDQSVAEHSYGVLLIAMALVDGEDTSLGADTILYAIMHDMNEIYTGDIPSGFKRRLKTEHPGIEAKLDGQFAAPSEEVKAIVKLADYLESIHYLREYGGSRFSERVLTDVMSKFVAELEVSKAPEGIVEKARGMLAWV